MTHDEYLKAANYWKEKDLVSKKINKDELLIKILEYIKSNNTCALATGKDDFVRCTPIEYSFIDEAFYMFSEGGEKFIGLENNKNVCLAIYDKYDGFSSNCPMIFSVLSSGSLNFVLIDSKSAASSTTTYSNISTNKIS